MTGVLDYTDLYDESPAGYEVEGVIQSLEPTRNEVNLVVDGGSVNQRRLLSKGSFVIVDELLAGKILRFVRVPDAVTYERQLAALKKLANVPNSRTGPPAMDIVRALFAQQRCPKDSTDASDPASRDDSPRTDGYDKGVGFFADAPEVATPKAARIVSADDLPPLDTRVARRWGGTSPSRLIRSTARCAHRALGNRAGGVDSGTTGTGKTGVVIEIIRRAVVGQRFSRVHRQMRLSIT